ncbi:MAG: hypothetical protein AAGA03_03770 [Planctomycetota bacterium]
MSTAQYVSPGRLPAAHRTGRPLANRYRAWPSAKAGYFVDRSRLEPELGYQW